MKNIVIPGGTAGLGRALARACIERGDNVLAIGHDPANGERFVADGGEFLLADLSLIGENERVVREIEARFPSLDALVLCTRFFRSHRRETSDGIEHQFALFYLSRYLLGHGLAGLLDKAPEPVIVNVAGPGTPAGRIHWDDLELRRGYDGFEALFQGGRLNDLLGVSYAGAHPGSRIRYALVFPGNVAGNLAGEFDPRTAAQVERMKAAGLPVATAVPPIIDLIDGPPGEPLSAFSEGRRLGLTGPSFDRADAARLESITRSLLSERG
ncbi:SDR family NAD(P)-dependent oxidoreductase [Actinomadura harenae]|uniref:SDR family NAD(P)-dependent oxidoreductase n=1 Tax=Actinomadura harenae TaxID=2483351 RepID=A0A3M2M3U7_9ACTN|nr:SDR family NAD(P)-dependent oxidoreductase [Actinomadura harenae]RMI41798.1 SDR family NAD(P)-dependent oxidoreductase [Actinomadura harenae]